MPSDAALYTRPALRERLKREIMDGERGGRPGQWSARKAQLLAAEYRRAGGGYRRSRSRSRSQRSLERWTAERWRADTRSRRALRDDGAMDRYLPDAAWRALSPAQRRATRQKKLRQSDQFVPNTRAAAAARRSASRAAERRLASRSARRLASRSARRARRVKRP